MTVPGTICDLTPGCGLLRSAVGSAANDAVGSVFDVFAGLLRDAADWLLNHLIDVVLVPSHLTAIKLSDAWFVGEANVMLTIALAVVAPMLLVATIGAIVHQDLRRLVRAWGVALPAAAICGVLAVGLTNYALNVSEALCQVVLSHGPSLHDAVGRLSLALATPGLPQLVAYLICVLIILGAVTLWLELVVRAAAVYVAVFFLPLALAGLIWPGSARVAKRMVELLVALILSKFVIVATLTLGASAIAEGSGPDAALAGGAILLLAAFAPFALLRLVPIVEAAAIGHLEGMSRRPGHAVQRGAQSAMAAASNPALALLRSGGGQAKEAAPSALSVRAQDVAPRPGWYPPAGGPGGIGGNVGGGGSGGGGSGASGSGAGAPSGAPAGGRGGETPTAGHPSTPAVGPLANGSHATAAAPAAGQDG